jgi:predicted alpha/beta superfamily hydrolase
VLNSAVLSGRRLTISVPALAERSVIAAPADHADVANLLVFHDGQNLADWRVVETIDALTASGDIDPTVVVAIDHAGERRIREFGYGAAGYARFVVRDVVPYMRDRYPVRRDRASTWIAGSSMGGLVTLQIAALYPDVFGKLFVLSPSVWWNRRSILRTIERPGAVARFLTRRTFGAGASRPNGLRADVDVWLSIGLNEGAAAVGDARRLRDTITNMRHGDVSRLRYLEDPDGEHHEASWARQFHRALEAQQISGSSAD